MVGEIRDEETAAIAFQAAQTGHLVLSTLHTNDAPSAVTRLMDLKVEDFQISAALLAVIGQRLVRKIHPDCKVPDSPTPQMLPRIREVLGDDTVDTFWKGAGCDGCLGSGYAGRIGIYEVLTVTPALKNLIKPNVAAHVLQKAAAKEGFQTLSQDGLRKAAQGLTSIEEVFRVAPLAAVPEAPSSAEGAVPEALSPGAPPAAAAAPAGKRPDSFATGGRPKVLIVDDSEEMLILLRQMLESGGYVVSSAENGETALQLAESEKPGLIVTDYNMHPAWTAWR